jgi:hypothetical protein
MDLRASRQSNLVAHITTTSILHAATGRERVAFNTELTGAIIPPRGTRRDISRERSELASLAAELL